MTWVAAPLPSLRRRRQRAARRFWDRVRWRGFVEMGQATFAWWLEQTERSALRGRRIDKWN